MISVCLLPACKHCRELSEEFGDVGLMTGDVTHCVCRVYCTAFVMTFDIHCCTCRELSGEFGDVGLMTGDVTHCVC
jgi:hypothetical protein